MELDKATMIREVRDYYHLPKNNDWADRIGKSEQVACQWANKGTFDPYIMIESFPELSAYWLLTGKGEMIYKKEESKEPDTDLYIKRSEYDRVCEELANQQKIAIKAQEQVDKLISIVANANASND